MNIGNNTILLEALGISKQYPGVRALNNVSISVYHGEIRGLVGENGAGKSTLVNIFSGVIKKPDGGRLLFEGQEVRINSPRRADDLGIAAVHQERSLFPNLDVATNLFFSSLGSNNPFFISDRKFQEKAKSVLASMSLSHVSPSSKVSRLSPAQQQLIEIARAVVKSAKLIILDEPTSSLSENETQILFRIIRELKEKGVSIIFVSHRLGEVLEICDRVTVLRDGHHIKTVDTRKVKTSELVELILGRKESEMYQKSAELQSGAELLRVEHLVKEPKIKDISFSLHQGEILGMAGLLGSGRTELVRTIFGLDKPSRGKFFIRGEPVHLRNPERAIKQGIGFITEDRHKEGLILDKSFKDNIVLANLRKYSTAWGWMLPNKEISAAEQQKEKLKIATPSLLRKVKFLSGGNQQKTVLAKWLETQPQIFIMDDPTRGIDVGTKTEFYLLISNLARQGAGILFISSELQELVNVCHRILVLHKGRFIAEYTGSQINSAKILIKMTEEGE